MVLTLLPLLSAPWLKSSGGEDWHGAICWAGRARGDVYVGGGGAIGPATDVEGCRDERSNSGRSDPRYPWSAPPLLGGIEACNADDERAKRVLQAIGGRGFYIDLEKAKRKGLGHLVKEIRHDAETGAPKLKLQAPSPKVHWRRGGGGDGFAADASGLKRSARRIVAGAPAPLPRQATSARAVVAVTEMRRAGIRGPMVFPGRLWRKLKRPAACGGLTLARRGANVPPIHPSNLGSPRDSAGDLPSSRGSKPPPPENAGR